MSALGRWKSKLERLQEAEAIATDVSEKFRLEEQIGEARAKIEELEAGGSPHQSTPPRSTKETRQIATGGTLTLVGILSLVAQVRDYLNTIFSDLPTEAIWIGGFILGSVGLGLAFKGFARKSRLRHTETLFLDPDNPAHLKGRQAEVKALMEELQTHSLLFLEGESGSGKSALVRSGLIPALKSEIQPILPIYINSYGQDWDGGPTRQLALALRKALADEDWVALGNPPVEETQENWPDLLELLDRRILLIFDQFDDYQAQHRKEFLNQGKWTTPTQLALNNPFWGEIQAGLGRAAFSCLFVTRQDSVDGLESVRFEEPEIYFLYRLERQHLLSVFREIFPEGAGVVAHPEAGWNSLKERLIDDLTEAGLVLPVQARVALQGLARLPFLRISAYERIGGIEGLEAGYLALTIAKVRQSTSCDPKKVLDLLRKLVHPVLEIPKSQSVVESKLVTEAVDSQILVMLEKLGVLRRRNMQGEEEEWSLYHDYLAKAVLALERKLRHQEHRIAEKKTAYKKAFTLKSKWKALLSPWETVQTVWAFLRRNIRLKDYGAFTCISALRFVPYLALISVFFWAVFSEGEDRYALSSAEAQRSYEEIASVLQNVDSSLTGQLAALRKLPEAITKEVVERGSGSDLYRYPNVDRCRTLLLHYLQEDRVNHLLRKRGLFEPGAVSTEVATLIKDPRANTNDELVALMDLEPISSQLVITLHRLGGDSSIWSFRDSGFTEPQNIKKLIRPRPDKSKQIHIDLTHIETSAFNRAQLTALGSQDQSFTLTFPRGANLKHAQLQGSDLSHSVMRGAKLDRANLQFADLGRATFEDPELEPSLISTQMQGAILIRAKLRGSRLYRVNLQGANLMGVNFEEVDIDQCELQGATLLSAKMAWATLDASNLTGAQLSHCNLLGASIEDCNLQATNLEGASLKGATFRNVNLRNANLTGVAFEGTSIQECNLIGTNLSSARFSGGDVTWNYELEGESHRLEFKLPPSIVDIESSDEIGNSQSRFQFSTNAKWDGQSAWSRLLSWEREKGRQASSSIRDTLEDLRFSRTTTMPNRSLLMVSFPHDAGEDLKHVFGDESIKETLSKTSLIYRKEVRFPNGKTLLRPMARVGFKGAWMTKASQELLLRMLESQEPEQGWDKIEFERLHAELREELSNQVKIIPEGDAPSNPEWEERKEWSIIDELENKLDEAEQKERAPADSPK